MFSKMARIVGHYRLLLERYRLRSRNALAELISTLLIVAGALALLIAIFAAAPLFATICDRSSASRATLLQATNPRQCEPVLHPAKEVHSHAIHPLNEAQAIILPSERQPTHE